MTRRYSMVALSIFLTAVFCCLSPDAYAQRVVQVEPGYGTLNEAISNDVNPDEAVFVLERGQEYLLSETIRYDGDILRIHGADGTGPRPIVYPGVDITGQAGNHFQPLSSIELVDLVIRGIDDLGADVRNPIRPGKDSARVVVDNCLLETAGQSFVRFDAPGMSFFMTNSTMRNVGITDSPGNGRLVDTRGNDADTIFVQNNTIYQNLAEHVRTGGGYVRYFLWDHNTSMNIGITTINLGRTVEARISNSIIANPYGRGDDDIDNPVMTIDSLVTAHGFTDADRDIVFENIVYFETPELQQAFHDTSRMSLFFDSLYTPFIAAGIVDTANIFVEQLAFENPPPSMIEYGTYVMSGGTSEYPAWRAYEDPQAYEDPTIVGDLPANVFNFSYPESARAYTAGTDGFPLGDLNWYPEIKEQWVNTGVEEIAAELPDAVRLRGNFPNPFNPSTTIQFDLADAASVEIVVMDVLGREVMAFPAKSFSAGNGHQVRIAADSLPSGVYFYQLRVRSALDLTVRTGQMVLLK